MQKEITLKRKTLIFAVLLAVGVVVGGFFIFVEESNKHCKKECQICSDTLVKEHFFRNFNGAVVRLSMKIKGEDYTNDFFNAIEVKDFIESVGKNDLHFTVDERVCNTIGDKNLTQMVSYGYTEALKKSKKDKSIRIFEESFFEGLEIIKEKCNTFPVQDR